MTSAVPRTSDAETSLGQAIDPGGSRGLVSKNFRSTSAGLHRAARVIVLGLRSVERGQVLTSRIPRTTMLWKYSSTPACDTSSAGHCGQSHVSFMKG